MDLSLAKHSYTQRPFAPSASCNSLTLDLDPRFYNYCDSFIDLTSLLCWCRPPFAPSASCNSLTLDLDPRFYNYCDSFIDLTSLHCSAAGAALWHTNQPALRAEGQGRPMFQVLFRSSLDSRAAWRIAGGSDCAPAVCWQRPIALLQAARLPLQACIGRW